MFESPLRVLAQDAGGAPVAPAAPQLTPPELLEPVEAAYPAEARDQRIEGTVVLELSIDAAGTVTGANVIEPVGHGFDEAARDAALRFRFAPARRNGEPIPSRIRYPYVFKLAPEPPPAPVTGVLSGRVLLDGTAAASVDVQLKDAAGVVAASTLTDPEGHFRLNELAPGDYTLGAALQERTASAQVVVTSGVEGTLDLALVAPAPPPPPAAGDQPVQVKVRGRQNEAQRLQQSAEAVNVIETRQARQQSADLGEVLARTQGVAVRRDGGLGSNARFSLNGLYGDQIRFFYDGVPLDAAGFPFGIANVPVNLVDRVEVYRGVVPVRFGADALGGAVNLVPEQSYRTRLGVGYQVGSFGTHRVSLQGRYRHDPSGFIVGGSGYFDYTKNNYKVDVEVPDARGRLQPATVERFHDRYKAYSLNLEVGVVGKPWAKRLTLQGYVSKFDKDLQHNIVMTVPYGEVAYGETVVGTTARYDVELYRNLDLELTANYAHRAIDYNDRSDWVYDWFGERVRERRVGGEIDTRPHDQTVWQNSGFGRGIVKWAITPEHVVRVSSSPAYTTRTGDERLQADPSARDPLTAKRELFTLVSGAEYELNLFSDRLSNIFFVKDYLYNADSEEPVPGGAFRTRDMNKHSNGIGDSFRFKFADWIMAKASYEFATRLPRPDEVFGDAVLIQANLQLEPEVSHNGNLGVRLEHKGSPAGDFLLDINGFIRDSDKLIVLLGNDRYYTFRNVYKACGKGLENAAGWVSPGKYVSIDGMLTWQDIRNCSSEGTFGDFDGDRIPNRPYLFSSWGARLGFSHVLMRNDRVEPYYNGRYVHAFFRGWESQGLREFKQTVDAQVSHNVGVSWILNHELAQLTGSIEVDNLTNARLFDNFGVQRPGRAFYVKVTGELR